MNKEIEILLVEDNNDDAQLTIRALKGHLKHELVWLKDGAETLDFLYAKGAYKNRDISIMPKVILLDLKMPKVNGIELLRVIKSHESTKHIPVVVMTSSNEESDLKTSYQLGVNSYVVKPIDFRKFTDAARKVSLYWLSVNRTITD